MKEIKAFLERVQKITKEEMLLGHGVERLFMNTGEELGEFAGAVSIEDGLKKKPAPKESSVYEAVDLIICALSLYYVRGGTDAELAKIGQLKLNKWAERTKLSPENIERSGFHRKHISHNRKEIEQSKKCVCFYCFTESEPKRINYTSSVAGASAMCPSCSIDAVIGDASGLPIFDKEFQAALNNYLFGNWKKGNNGRAKKRS